MNDLKQKTLRGGLAKLCGQGAGFVLRLGTTATLARLLDPKDFGLVAMVTVVTGVYEMFTSAGLSSATIQHANVTEEQLSTLFWVNIAVGTALALLCLVTAPVLASFYHEPRLFWVTVTLAGGFLVNAAGVQHSALLQRQMRFGTLTVIDILTQAVSLVVGIAAAIAGFGYWALVTMALVTPVVGTASKWFATKWLPGRPRRGTGIRPMLRFGGTMTLNSCVIYLAYNLEKILLGRFWGAGALGLYGRAFNLVNIPTENLNSTVGGVAFSALSRLQDDPVRMKHYFLKGYSLVMSMTLPITIFCALFADDLIFILLGPKWKDAVVLFRLLTPTVLIFGMINPFSWLLMSSGMQVRSLKIAMVIAPLVIVSEVCGLPYGPRGVAFAYSASMTLWLVPHILWCIQGTQISLRDLLRPIGLPLVSILGAAAVTLVAQYYCGPFLPPLPRLVVGGSFMFGLYLWILLFIMGEKEMYLRLFRGMRQRPETDKVITDFEPV